MYSFIICRLVKLPGVKKAVKKVATPPLDDQPVTIDDEPANMEDMKPLIVPTNVPKENKAGGGTCAVSMEHLKIKLVHDKLPTERAHHSEHTMHLVKRGLRFVKLKTVTKKCLLK